MHTHQTGTLGLQSSHSLLSHLSEFLLKPGLDGLEVFNPLPGCSQLILELCYLSLELPLLLLKVIATLHTAGMEEKRVNN